MRTQTQLLKRPTLVDGLLVLALAVVLGWPLAATVWEALRPSGAAVGGGLIDATAFARDVGRTMGPAGETIRLVLGTIALALPLGVALALVLFRTDAWSRRGGLLVLAVSVFVPLPLYAAGWLGGLGNVGRSQVLGSAPMLSGWIGSAFVHAMACLPWVVLLSGVGLRTVTPSLEESAWLHRSAWRVLATITLRRALGAILGATLIVAVLTAGDMTVTDLLQVRTYAEEAYLQYGMGRPPGRVALVALPPLVVLGVLIGLAGRALLTADLARLPAGFQRAKLWQLGNWRVPLGLLTTGVIGFFVGLPIYALIWRAGRVGGMAALGIKPSWSVVGLWETLQNAWGEVAGYLAATALWAALAATISVAIAWALAWKSRGPGPWRWGVAGSVAVLLAAPGPVAGMALVLAYRDVPWIYDTAAIVIIGYVFKTLPFALLVLWPAIRTVPRTLLESAAIDGYGPAGQVRRVALPLTRGAILASWGVAFVLALGELPIANLVAPPGASVLSVFLWGLLHTGVESHLAGVGLVLLGVFAALGFFVAWALQRSIDKAIIKML